MDNQRRKRMTDDGGAKIALPDNLRRQAEERLHLSRADVSNMAIQNVQELVHELQVHQIELEMSNDDLLQTQIELADARDQYLDLYECAPVGYLTIDERFMVRQANLTVATMLGVERGKLVGAPLLKYIVPEEHDACFLYLREALMGGSRYNGEGWFVRQDGSRFFAQMQSSNAEPTGATSAGLRIIIVNATEQKRTELKLAESEKRYRFLYEESTMVNLVLGADGTIIDANRQAIQNFGYQKNEVVGKLLISFVVPKERVFVSQWLAAVNHEGKREIVDVRICAKDGSERTLMVVPGAILVTEENRTSGALFSAADITERKQIEHDLAQTRYKLEELVRQQHSDLNDTRQWLVVEKDQRKSVEGQLSQRRLALDAVYAMAMAFNKTGESLFDQVALAVADILHVPFAVVRKRLNGDEHTAVSVVYNGNLLSLKNTCFNCQSCEKVDSLRKVNQTNEATGMVCDVCNQFAPDQEFKSYIGVPILDSYGKMYGGICCFDVQRRSFDEFEVHLIEIFGRYMANEVAQGIMEQKVYSTQEMKMLGQLTAGVAHEVRNPLNTIIAVIDALFMETGENPALDPYKRHLNSQIKRLMALMEDLLSLGRPVTEKNFTEIGVPQLFSEIEAMCLLTAKPGRNPLEFCLPEEAQRWRVNVDTLRIQQVFMNLIENSRQNSPPNAAIRIIAEPVDTMSIRVNVIDKGPGIAPQHVSRLFEPFFTTRKSGTGLGLCIVRHIIKSHGGEVKIYNNEPEGSGMTAELLLPLVAVHSLSI